ncbi:hypothetical protein BGZ88_005250, partial [Linnemannia elongata]
QQSSLNPKILGSAAAAHGKGLTTLKKRRRCNTEDAHNDNETIMNVTDPTLMTGLSQDRSRKIEESSVCLHWPNLIVVYCIHQHQHQYQRRHSHRNKL